MAPRLLAAIGLIVLSLLASLFGAHVRSLRGWDRPAWTRTRAFTLGWGPVHRVLLVSGLALLASAAPIAAAAVAAALLTVWARLRWLRSEACARRRLAGRIARLRSENRDLPEREALRRALIESHPEWGREFVEQVVGDHPTIRGAARVLVRMERGWR